MKIVPNFRASILGFSQPPLHGVLFGDNVINRLQHTTYRRPEL